MKVVVVGGSGRIGSRLVRRLARDGHEVVAASRRTGVDIVAGSGLPEVLQNASVVVDVSDSPSFEDAAVMAFFETGTRHLLAAEAAAGVGHHVVLSVVGSDRLRQGGYFRAKCAQEQLVAGSSIPYSIVRTTQFFEFLGGIADGTAQGGIVRVPPTLVQPIAADDVAGAIARIAGAAPLNRTIDIGGPEAFYLDAVLERVLGAGGDRRTVITDPHAHYFGAPLGPRTLVAEDDAELGTTRFEDWLADTVPSRPAPPTWSGAGAGSAGDRPRLEPCEFRVSDVPPGSVLLLGEIAVFSVEGGFCATQARCTHKGGPLSEGTLDGSTVTCPLHGAQFNVWSGAVLRGPAQKPLTTYAVTVDGEVGRIDVPVARSLLEA